MKKLLLYLCSLLILAGCGVTWFPDPKASSGSTSNIVSSTNTSVNTASADTVTSFTGADQIQNGANKSVTLYGAGISAKGAALNYQWTLTGTNTSSATLSAATQATATFSATATGTYLVQLKVTSGLGPAATATVKITVNAASSTEAVTASAGTDQVADGSGSANAITLLGSVTSLIDTAPTIQWSVTSGDVSSARFGTPNKPITTFYANQAGTYTLKLTITSITDNTKTASGNVTVTVPTPALGAKGSYFPLTADRSWAYASYSGGAGFTSDTVTSLTGNILSHNRISSIDNSSSISTATYITSSGLLLTIFKPSGTQSGDVYTPGLPIMPSVLDVGSYGPTGYDLVINGVGPAHEQATLKVIGVESIALPFGTFSSLHIQGSTTGGSAETNMPVDAWYVKGIGLVKDSTTRLRLQSYLK